MGDGNFHVLLLFDPQDPHQVKKSKEIATKLAQRAIKMGGTCTGEHGIGFGKKNLLLEQFGTTGIDVMWSIKNMIDPKGVMNPGKVLPMI